MQHAVVQPSSWAARSLVQFCCFNVKLFPVISDLADQSARLVIGNSVFLGEVAHLIAGTSSDALPVWPARLAASLTHALASGFPLLYRPHRAAQLISL